MKVCKFGGTSLATAGQIEKVYNIIASDTERRIVVVSAPGKRFKEDTKVTDMLINSTSIFLLGQYPENEIKALTERFTNIAAELGISDAVPTHVKKILTELFSKKPERAEVFIDTVKAMGEDFNARLVAEYFNSKGLKARYLNPGQAGLILSSDYGNAYVLPESYDNLAKIADYDGVTVFPGFFGYTKEGGIVTFPRGGSDITGAVLAVGVKASIYENFTDVDSVFAVNPNIVKNPKGIPEYTYREMRELAYMGFSVLHEETLTPVYRASIPVNIKNTNNPSAPGTFIVPERKSNKDARVTGIASDNHFIMIDVTKYMMNREIGFGRRLLQIFEEEGISYEHTPSGIDSISVIFRSNYASTAKLRKIEQRIKDELAADEITVRNDISLIAVVGEGMKRAVGLMARASLALANAGVNIELINQGASEISILFGIHDADEIKAVRALYSEFFE